MNINLKSKLKLLNSKINNNMENKINNISNDMEKKIHNNMERKCCEEQTSEFFTMKRYDNNLIEFIIKPSDHLNAINNIKIDKIFFINLSTYEIIDFCDIIINNNSNNLCDLKISVNQNLYDIIKPTRLQINYTIKEKKYSINGYYIENKFVHNNKI